MSVANPQAGGSSSFQPLTRVAIIGPFAALLAVPTAIFPNNLGEIATTFLTCATIILFGILGKYTRLPIVENAADTVLDRAVNAKRNWEHDTLRSFVETVCWLYVTFQIHLVYHNAVLSAVLGAMAGFGMTAVGSLLTMSLRTLECHVAQNYDLKHWKFAGLATPEALMLGGVLLFGVAMRVGRQESATVRNAAVSAVLASTCLVTLGQLLIRWSPTHRYGSIVHDRLVNCGHNWSSHTLRSGLETSLWLSAVWGSYSHTSDLLSATLLGGFAGLMACVIGQEILTSNLESVEKHLTKLSDEDLEYRENNGITVLGKKFYKPPRLTAKSKRQPSKSVAALPVKPGAEYPSVTMAQVAAHNTNEDIWVVVDGHAYDITSLLHNHPGGMLPIQNMAGKDCTDAFMQYHTQKVHQTMLPQYYIGPVSDYEVSDFVKGHRAIRQELLRRGLFETNPIYYVKKAIWLASLFVPSICGVVLSDKTWVHMLSAVGLGCFWQQMAFIGHDVGHNGITHIQDMDNFYGTLIGNPLLGISLAWWKKSHNVHHIVCNSVEHDPDIQHLPVMAVTNKIFGRFWSTFHEKWMATDLAARTLVSYQHFLFYPIMAVARVNLYIQSWKLLLSNEKFAYKKLEIAGLAAFVVWFAALICALPTANERIAFIAISHAVSGLLHVQICISHFTMDAYNGHPYNDDSDEWFRMQLKTTMNVDCPQWLDWFHGGLQFQIEHHLYPRLPRHNLREARVLVKKFCEENDVHYHEPGFWQANVELVSHLKATAMDARKLQKGDGGFYESQLWEGMNAQG